MAKITIENVYNEHKPLLEKRIEVVEIRLNKFNLEVPLIFVFFGWNLSLAIIPNQLLKQTCLMEGFKASDCAKLNASKEIEEHVQPFVAEILMTMTLVTTFVPGVMSLFLGPWTDKYGRKKVICATFLGYSLSLASFVLISIISDYQTWINPWFFVLAYIPTIISGGFPSMNLAILCFVSDITDEVNRSFRLTMVEIIIFVGMLTGTVSSSFILKLTSATAVFAISTSIVALASFYTICFMYESSTKFIQKESLSGQLSELLSIEPIKDMVKTCLKRRAKNDRKVLWCLIVILIFYVFTVHGTSTMFYLFVREKFQWTLKEATLYESSAFIISNYFNNRRLHWPRYTQATIKIFGYWTRCSGKWQRISRIADQIVSSIRISDVFCLRNWFFQNVKPAYVPIDHRFGCSKF